MSKLAREEVCNSRARPPLAPRSVPPIMPARPNARICPSVYLDTSTLSYAFGAAAIGAHASLKSLAPLLSFVEDVAHQSNLVFSHIHLSEIAQWQDTTAARAMVTWLDSLPLVWARLWTYVQAEEFENHVKLVAGCPSPEPVRAFAPSMLSAFESMTAASAVGILDTPTLVAAFELERVQAPITARMNAVSRSFAEQLNANRAAFVSSGTDQVTLQEQEERIAYRRRVRLRRGAMDAHKRLIGKQDLEYVASGATLNDIVDPLVDLYDRVPASLPLTRVLDRLGAGLARTAAARTTASQKFNALDSSLADIFHAAIGAAYCTVFTCDQLTAEWLGDVRSGLGFGPPIVYRGDPDAFVSSLASAHRDAPA